MKLVMVVPYTSGTRTAKILAEDIMNGRSLYEFVGDWTCTSKNYS